MRVKRIIAVLSIVFILMLPLYGFKNTVYASNDFLYYIFLKDVDIGGSTSEYFIFHRVEITYTYDNEELTDIYFLGELNNPNSDGVNLPVVNGVVSFNNFYVVSLKLGDYWIEGSVYYAQFQSLEYDIRLIFSYDDGITQIPLRTISLQPSNYDIVSSDMYNFISDNFVNSYDDGYNVGYEVGHFDGYNNGYADGYTDGFQTDVYNMYLHNEVTFSYDSGLTDVKKTLNGYTLYRNPSRPYGFLYMSVGFILYKDVTYTLSFDYRKFNENDNSQFRMNVVEKVAGVDNVAATMTFYEADTVFQRYVLTFTPSFNVQNGRLYLAIWSESGGEICDIQLNEGYNDVYRNNAFDVGFEAGYVVGYNFGKEIGAQSSITTSWFSQFLSGFASLFSIQLFPNITLGTIVGVSLLLGFIGFLFRFKGGG